LDTNNVLPTLQHCFDSTKPGETIEIEIPSGLLFGDFVRMVEDTGFRMIHTSYDYKNPETFSLPIRIMKPTDSTPSEYAFENDVAIGTFTNKTTCIVDLWKSALQYLPKVQFVTRFNDGPINTGMFLLREDFIKTGKRFWVFLDDDIQFLNSEIVRNAISVLLRTKSGAVSVYSTFSKDALSENYNSTNPTLEVRPVGWAVGYFIMIDSWRVGEVLPDMALPYPNQSIDTSYSIEIMKAGYNIYISNDYVYHTYKDTKVFKNVIDETNAYLHSKWGQFYFNHVKYDYNVIDKFWTKG
jgi:hypothetical protein